MYYITNQNDRIIAIDSTLLALLGVDNIDELYREIALENITFSSVTEDGKITISTIQNEKTYNTESHDLSGISGNITLVQIQTSTAGSMLLDDDSVSEEEYLDINTVQKNETGNENEIFDPVIYNTSPEAPGNEIDNEDLFTLRTTEENEISILDDTFNKPDDIDIEENKRENENEIFDLILPDTPENTIDEISLVKNDTSPIFINIEEISQTIGISTKDYNTFLNEYIDTALSLEKDLQDTQEGKGSNAIHTLSHLSNVLHLPIITTIVTQIKNASVEDQSTYIKSFYAALSRLVTSQPTTAKKEIEPVTTTSESFGTINLDDVKPIYFDFQLEEAAKDLSLPIALIEEFVHDFIQQGRSETKKMLEAYEKGDLDTIQKIGHLLKGASSNLRINPLSDTLYEIQFCEDSSKLEDLIKQYWGHFLSFETQMNLTSK